MKILTEPCCFATSAVENISTQQALSHNLSNLIQTFHIFAEKISNLTDFDSEMAEQSNRIKVVLLTCELDCQHLLLS